MYSDKEKILSSEKKVINQKEQTQKDSELWNQFRMGCEKSLMIIFDKHIKMLYKYGYKIVPDEALVKDSIQELFIDLWRRHKTLGETASIKFYLLKCLRRKLYKMHPGNEKNLFIEDLDENQSLLIESSYETDLIKEQTSTEKRNQILTKLNLLSKRQREAIFLKYYEDLSYDEIGSLMSLSRQSAYNLIHRALSALKHFFILLLFLL